MNVKKWCYGVTYLEKKQLVFIIFIWGKYPCVHMKGGTIDEFYKEDCNGYFKWKSKR
jgi:hypothetical protein